MGVRGRMSITPTITGGVTYTSRSYTGLTNVSYTLSPFTYSGILVGDLPYINWVPPPNIPSTIPSADAGTYTLTVTQAFTVTPNLADPGLATRYTSPATGNFTVTITKAPLTITANNSTKTYGDADPAGYNGVSYIGFVNGETASVLPVQPTVARTQSGEDVGSYSLTALLSVDPQNYIPNLQTGVLTINQKTLSSFSVTDVEGADKTYDTTPTATTTGNPSAAGLLGTDGVIAAMKDGATNFVDGAGNPTSAAGTHSLAGVVKLVGAKAANYTPQESSALVLSAQKTIAKAELPVSGLTAQSKVADGTTTLKTTGLATVTPFAGDTVSVSDYSAVFPSAAVGCYNITGSVTLGGPSAGNYTGTLTFSNVCITAAQRAPIPVRNAVHGNAAIMNDRYANAAQYSTPVGYRKPLSQTELLKQKNGINATRFIR